MSGNVKSGEKIVDESSKPYAYLSGSFLHHWAW